MSPGVSTGQPWRHSQDRKANLKFSAQFFPFLYFQVSSWPAKKKWSRKHLGKAFKDSKVIVGEYPMSFKDYLLYMDRCTDDMPLYLFDKQFLKKAPKLASEYKVSRYNTPAKGLGPL